MHSVLWVSILASAGVAVVTTLLVEYLAKPGLEARKDRILEKRREQRVAIKGIHEALFMVEILLSCKEVTPYRIPAEYLRTNSEQFSERMRIASYVFMAPESADEEWARIIARIHGLRNGGSIRGGNRRNMASPRIRT